MMIKRFICTALAVLTVMSVAYSVIPSWAEVDNTTPATEYTAGANITVSTGEGPYNLTDGAEGTFLVIPAGGSISVNAEGSSAVYIKFRLSSVKWTAVWDGGSAEFGTKGYLHEYARIPECGGKFTMNFAEEAKICELRIFGEGTPPEDVQVWDAPHEKADVVLLTSHSDDEQLFFAGLIPHCVANDIDIQVVYFCYHDDVPARLHEQLNGLWTAGLRNYPVIGRFPDLYSESLEWAMNAFGQYGYTEDHFVSYQCEIIRRFKPEIIVGHDVNGEYGHGTHRLNTDTLMKALELTADPGKYAESAEKYGVWDVPKTYIHLYEERPIVMDYDTPLEYFGGRTAYEMSVEGYGCHYTQHWTWFTDWLIGTDGAPITAASQITEYSPCKFGLYRSTVGDDKKGDMFENVTLRKDIPPETLPPETTEPVTETEKDSNEITAAESSTESHGTEKEHTLGADEIFIAVIVVVVLAVGVMAFSLRKDR